MAGPVVPLVEAQALCSDDGPADRLPLAGRSGGTSREDQMFFTPRGILGGGDLKGLPGVSVMPSCTSVAVRGLRSLCLPAEDSKQKKPTGAIVRECARKPYAMPAFIVSADVTKVMARTASADILCVGSKAVKEKFTAIIINKLVQPKLPQQDVRATEIDKVDIYQSFRPGDIVKAVVLSLGDARAYYLSTAKNELGVVSAQSIADILELIRLDYGGYLVCASKRVYQPHRHNMIDHQLVLKVEVRNPLVELQQVNP
ncbi:hypothetical protein KSP39_PZI014849 [Platanthera zijinensis]|uniref:Exosome complex component CSL4 C-terminal domain-containing protein n=1 Tax=Platanthera zijinensis TaxID=2320716 RepID=A0AAP0BAD1_9ASPA